MAGYMEKNGEREKARKAKYQLENKERYKAYRERNKDAIRKKKAAWRLANLDKARALSREYAKRNRWKITSYTARRRASKLKRTPKWLTAEDIRKMREIQLEAKRLSELTGITHHVDHILPLRGKYVSGLHVPDNLQVLPGDENRRKSNHWYPE